MKRREFISLLGGAAAWPLAARGQQPALPVVGFLHSSVPIAGATHLTTAFRQGLKEAGFVEGQNVTIEFRSAEGQPDRLRALVAELIRLPVAVLAGNTLAMLAAKEATITVPIVFAGGTDPVKVRLVDSLSRPGGNVTGASFFGGVLGAKRLELFRQLVPKATTIAMLVRPNTIETEAERRDVQAAAQALGQHLVILDATSARDIDAAFATFVQRGDGALLVGAGPFMVAHRKQVIALAARYALPASYALREFVEAGGLMSYGDSRRNLYICPAGATLTTSGRVHSDHAIRYFASVPRCRECPLKQRCCPNMPSRRIVRDVNEAARDIARRKMQTKAFLKSRDQRKRVEMRFAHLKTHHGFERMRLRGLPAPATSSISPPSFKTSRPWPCACSDHRLNWRKRELGRQYHLSTRTQQLSSKTTAKQFIGLTNPANLANHRVFRQHRPGPDSDSHWPEAGRVVK